MSGTKVSIHDFNKLIGKSSISNDLASIDEINHLTSTFTCFKSLNNLLIIRKLSMNK